MITADYHVHSSFSADSRASMESMIEKALTLGLTRICFTEHMDFDYPEQYGINFWLDVDAYMSKADELSLKYKDRIKILRGIELGVMPYLGQRCEDLINSYPFDFVIASSHLINHMDPYYPEYWEEKTDAEGIREYFQTIIDNISAFQNFDSYGHLDYIVRYAPFKNKYYSYEAFHEVIDRILKEIIRLDKCIEVNTAGFKYGLSEANPCRDILKRYLELGGKYITIGSDGHMPEHLAFDFTRARELLMEIGFMEYAVYEGRKRIMVEL